MLELRRLRLIADALEFAMDHANGTERPMFSSMRESWLMCVRKLKAIEPTSIDLAARLPWESSVGPPV
jgi:hypothetical protein